MIGSGLLVLFSPQQAHADDGRGLGLGETLQGVVSTVDSTLDEIVGSQPVHAVTTPVASTVDGLVGGTALGLAALLLVAGGVMVSRVAVRRR